jgi:glycosyltransferase involved in cell wall biosynthesis
MARLAIVDQTVSAGGVERFLHGLVGGMLDIPEGKAWDITLLLNPYNSGGYQVKWPDHLTAPNLTVRYLGDDSLGRFMNRRSRAKRVWGIPGTSVAQGAVPWLLRSYGTAWLQTRAGNYRLLIEQYCIRERFDVVYFSWPYMMDCPSLPMPMVTTPHDLNFKHEFTSDGCTNLAPRARAQHERQMPGWLHSCHRIVVSSDFMAAELHHFYPECEARIRVVRLGIPAVAETPTPQDLESCRTRLGLPKRFLLTAGWIIPHKNQMVIFKALGRLRQEGMDIPLVCVGPNSDLLQPARRRRAVGYFREVLKAAQDLNLQYGQDFFGLGYVTDVDLECLYRLAQALVLPSLYEAGSFPLIEAVRASCPVACSSIPSHAEQAGLLGGNVWLFDPHDPANLADVIREMLVHPEDTGDRAAQAAELVGKAYSWQKAAEGYLSVFSEAMQMDVQTAGGKR